LHLQIVERPLDVLLFHTCVRGMLRVGVMFRARVRVRIRGRGRGRGSISPSSADLLATYSASYAPRARIRSASKSTVSVETPVYLVISW
tara:strand:- start:1093 stop:1359 length:267 start_codon:yes stop_codon:yes gene_type:complete